MAKDPAFLFYPGDWLGGTLGMTFEEKGAYMELLMMQFTRGHMTEHMIAQCVGQLWVKLQDKFSQDDNGLWFNGRLDEEKEKRKNYVDSRKNNKKGSNQHTKPKSKNGGHMNDHMENVNVNEITIEDEVNLVNAAKKILTDFGFNEISGMNKLRQIKEALNHIFTTGRIEYFMEQYENYMVYKKQKKERVHGLEKFFDFDNQFENPGWDSNTWSLLIIQTAPTDKMTATVNAFAKAENPFRK